MYIYVYEYIYVYIHIHIYEYSNTCTCMYIYIHRETMGLEGGVYLYHDMTTPPNLGHSCVIFEGWSQILP